jgi:putative membrane protein
MRGSVLARIWKSLVITTVLAMLVTWTDGALWHHKITLTTIPFTLIGLPLAIFLGFRNNSAYDRYWEGRKLWGELVLRKRNFARQCLSLIDTAQAYQQGNRDDIRDRMVRRAIAYGHALRHHLRSSSSGDELRPFLPEAEWQRLQTVRHVPHILMLEMGKDLSQCVRDGRLDPCLAASIDSTISAIVGAGAACERIKSTPIPFSYTLLLHRTAYIYCFLLPFGLVDTIGFMTPFVVAIVAYTFFGLDALGDEIEEPFGTDANDLPLNAITRGIEVDLREALGDADIPSLHTPVDHCLT